TPSYRRSSSSGGRVITKSRWCVMAGWLSSESGASRKRVASRPTQPSPALAAAGGNGSPLSQSRGLIRPRPPRSTCCTTFLALTSPADDTDSSFVVELAHLPPAAPLGRVREYHPFDCRTPRSRTSTPGTTLTRGAGAVPCVASVQGTTQTKVEWHPAAFQ